ncbi:MAG: hypothetical protein KJO40_13400 [Deltaproteobacteria bacterium]|nr:hypothetical protein [Deltaproteobacteria bacterium]
MRISYGPPGQKGVTTMMAVGADEYGQGDLEKAVKTGGLVAVGVWGLGWLLGSKTMRNVGLGAGLALFGVQTLSKPQKVAVTTPTPQPQGCISCIV